MLILPAIDLRAGRCVRLRQGDYAQETVFDNDPAAVARRFAEQGAEFLHIVDLDGAREGRPVNADSVRSIIKASNLPCELGGGLRSENDIAFVLGLGVERVVIGTRAAQVDGWLEEMCRRFPGRIALGIDARTGRVASNGWLQTSQLDPLVLARRLAGLPLAALIYTEIERDGMLQGPAIDGMRQMVDAARPLAVIASGGVTSSQDVVALARAGVAGCIIGRALYEEKIKLAEVLTLVSTME